MRTAVLIYTGELDKDPTLLCSGTLLSEDIIITAATCFDAGLDDLDDFTIVAGDLQAYLAGQPNTAEKIGVQGVSIHPHYDHDYDYDYDDVLAEEPFWNMAIVQLKRKVNLDRNPNMEAAMLPPPGMKHTGKLVQFGGLATAPDGSVYLLAKKAKINPDEHCQDELVEGMFFMEKVCVEKKESRDCKKIAAGSPAIYRGWEKPLVIGMSSVGSSSCPTDEVFTFISKFLPWIFRETRIRPSYEVFDDDKLFEEYHRGVTLQYSLCSKGVEAEQITDKSTDVMVDSTPITTTGPLSNSESLHSTPTPVEGILISGGGLKGGAMRTSVELFNPVTGLTCSLPDLPDNRNWHSMSGLTICGGDDMDKGIDKSLNSCLVFSQGEWSAGPALAQGRRYHCSWVPQEGTTLLMGGYDTDMTTELVGQGPSFPLKYDTAGACAIPALDSVILTGGRYTMDGVSKYGLTGHLSDLAPLLVGRYGHGCGGYYRQDTGTQVILVAGGTTVSKDYRYSFLSSTEQLVGETASWKTTTSLPRAMNELRGISVDNTIYMTGGYDEDTETFRDEILAWDADMEDWVKVGLMKVARSDHALSTVNMQELVNYCG